MAHVVVENNKDFESAYNAYTSNNGNVKLTKFTGVGTTGDGSGFQEGDVISLPDDIAKAMIGVKIQGSQKPAEALLCQVTSADGVRKRFQPFFPKSLAKRILKLDIDSDGKVLEKYTKPDGSAAEWWQSQAGRDVNEIVKDLIALGKDIRVDKAETVDTYRYGTTEKAKTTLYTYTLV